MAKKAWVHLRFTVEERRAAVCEGLRRVGFEPREGLTRTPSDSDILISWNRIHEADEVARIFTARKLPVLILENASWGNSFAGDHWYTMCKNYHNVSGTFPIGGHERWDSLGVELEPWRTSGEVVILASRGIGPACYAMPRAWPERQRGRLRPHPGRGIAIPLRDDLARCGRILTWGSGSALLGLMWGIPVTSYQPQWIGEQDNTDAGRLAMFRRLAWAQARLSEISSGEAFSRLLTAR